MGWAPAEAGDNLSPNSAAIPVHERGETSIVTSSSTDRHPRAGSKDSEAAVNYIDSTGANIRRTHSVKPA